MSRRRPLSYLAELAVATLCFERRSVDPGLLTQLRTDAAGLAAGVSTVIADALWEAKRAELRRLLATGEAGRFMRWPPVRTTMVKRGHWPVTLELRHMRRRADWPRWRRALREMTLGRPRPFPRLPTTSANALHLAYHLCRFEEATGVRPETATFVLEFGGGYGGMCRMLHRLGFRGTYAIFDLPEVTALQRFYLGHARLPVRHWAGEPIRGPGIVTLSALDDLPRVVGARPSGTMLFVATWSLGETPLGLRKPVLAAVADFDAFLLGYTSLFADIDNRAVFASWRTGLPDHTWHELPLPHLGKAEFYLFGARRASGRAAWPVELASVKQ